MPHYHVSILVLLEVALRHTFRVIKIVTLQVSILVLLEVALRRIFLVFIIYSLPVSILVLLEVALRPTDAVARGIKRYRFQSLFYWKLLCDTQQSTNKPEHDSFNPCFIGSCSATPQISP